MNENELLIHRFYDAFAKGDAETMAQCYHAEARFSDPAFGTLEANEARDMWRMLLANAKGRLIITHNKVEATDTDGSAHWTARYHFSRTGRDVTNHIKASFVFKDGKIFRHDDYFSFWRWSQQAFGAMGWMIGWSGWFQRKVRKQGLQSLLRFRMAA